MRDADRNIIFDCAVTLANTITEQCDALVELCDYIEERVPISRRIASFESNADESFHNLGFYFLAHTLMSDPDAVALLEVVKALEQITDCFEVLANSFVRYNVTTSGELLSECSTALYGACRMTQDIVIYLRDKAPSSLILRDVTSLDKYKSKYCKYYDDAILELFSGNIDAVELIRSKAIYDAFKVLFESFETLSEKCYLFIISYY